MQEVNAVGWYGGAPKYAYQVRYSFGVDNVKKGYTVVRYDVLRTYLEAEVLADGLTLIDALNFEKLLGGDNG